jgi:ADP-ribosylation factor-like protein 2
MAANRRYNLNIWDVGGQATLRPFWRNYFEKTDFLVWVVDISALDRLDDCRRELHNTLNEDRLIGAGLLIWVNKLDIIMGSDEEKLELVNKVQQVCSDRFEWFWFVNCRI